MGHTPLLSATAGGHTRWRPWIILWMVLIVIQGVLLANHAALDTLAWRTTRWFTGDQDAYKWATYKQEHAGDADRPFYERINPPMTRLVNGQPVARFYGRTEKIWRLLRDLGEPYLTAVLLALVIVYDRRKWGAGVMLLAGTAAAGLLGALIRMTGGRFRPIATDGLNRWEWWRGFHDGSNLSWPSGHATAAFATAAVLAYLSPRGRWLFILLAAGCAVARVVMQAHFWSDVAFGSVLGWTVGWFIAARIDVILKSKK